MESSWLLTWQYTDDDHDDHYSGGDGDRQADCSQWQCNGEEEDDYYSGGDGDRQWSQADCWHDGGESRAHLGDQGLDQTNISELG